MQLSVIIVNYNVKYFLEHCLMSVLAAGKELKMEVLVVDNHSQDGSREYFKNRFPQVQFFWLGENTGFSKANNFALKKATGKYVLFLNPDTLVPEDCFTCCLEFMEQQNTGCAMGIKMIDGAGNYLKESKRGFPSPLVSLFKLSGLSALFPKSKTFARYYLGHLPVEKTQEVEVLAGAFMLIPAEILKLTGGFDENFFMYGEDIDLSYRIQKAGLKNMYFAGSSIIHFKGESTKKGTRQYVNTFYSAMNIFVKKHYAGSGARLFPYLLQGGIFMRKLVSAARAAAGSTSTRSVGVLRESFRFQRVIFVGLPENVPKVSAFLKTKIKRPFEIEVVDRLILTGLSECVIVFCEEHCTFKYIIETLPVLPVNVKVFFYSVTCNSWIG